MRNGSMKGIKKWTLAGGLTLATLFGTFSPHKNDFPPFYTNKTGKGYGISVGLISNSEKDSKFYGGSFSFINVGEGKMSGLEFGVVNSTKNGGMRQFNGFQAGLLNLEGPDSSMEVNGFQIGFVNSQTNGDVVQIGIYNSSTKDGNARRSFLFNYDFR